MAEHPDDSDYIEVPEGVSIFPEIPEELGIHPLFLAMLQSYVFLAGSEENIVHPAAAEEALGMMEAYLQRIKGPDLKRLKEDIETLIGFAKDEKWDPDSIEFLKEFLSMNGIKG
jgi:hypothetical protein